MELYNQHYIVPVWCVDLSLKTYILAQFPALHVAPFFGELWSSSAHTHVRENGGATLV